MWPFRSSAFPRLSVFLVFKPRLDRIDLLLCESGTTLTSNLTRTVERLSDPVYQLIIHLFCIRYKYFVLAHASGRHANESRTGFEAFRVKANFEARSRTGADHGKLLFATEANVCLLWS